MVNKNINAIIILVVLILVIFILLLGFGNSHGFLCSNQNITLANSSGFVCTYQWVKINGPVSLVNKTILARGLFINNTFSITGNSTLNASTIINKGNATIDATLLSGAAFENYGTLILRKPVFLNFSYFLNYGSIVDENYLNNGGYTNGYDTCIGGSFPYSFAGSGGGSLANFSSCEGGNTLAEGGTGQVTSYKNHILYPIYNSSGNHVYSALSNYSFNLSLLNSAGGASYNAVNNTSLFMRGGSGVLPLIIISRSFNNIGTIYNQGQSINYSAIKNASKFLAFGIVGAGGGGVIEVISSKFINDGIFNVSGGRIYLNNQFLPFPYNTSNLGYGGSGNVFFFKANNNLLLNSIHNLTLPLQVYSVNTSSNPSNKSYAHFVVAKVETLSSCSLNNIYIDLKGYNGKDRFTESHPINDSVFLVNSSSSNLSLSLSGNNPMINYYGSVNISINKTSNKTISQLNLSNYLPVNIIFMGGKNLNFSLLKGKNIVFSGRILHRLYSFKLKSGNYSLYLENNSENYNYSLYVAPNCLGYENITIPLSKSYYIYNSLKIPFLPVIEYKVNKTTKEINNYKYINSCNFNISDLIGMDRLILSNLSYLKSNLSMLSENRLDYENLLGREINYTDYMLNTYNTRSSQKSQNIYLNQTGLNLLSYYNNGNFTKEVFQINNNGTINLSYGVNKTIEIVLTKRTQQTFLASMENDIVKVFSYVPSLFLGFLGGL